MTTTTAPVAAGDRVMLERRQNNAGSIRFSATINSVDRRAKFWYVGYRPDAPHLHGRFGYFRIPFAGESPYGTRLVTILA